MSIAISVVLHPSKIMRACAVLFAFLLVCVGIYIGCLNHLSILNRSILFAVCGFAAWRIFLYSQRIAKTSWHISIDGQGQLRCQSNFLQQRPSSTAQEHLPLNSDPLTLGAGTTLWAHALFLRLRNQENEVVTNLVILPDALCKDEFRRLSVACKWIVQSESTS